MCVAAAMTSVQPCLTWGHSVTLLPCMQNYAEELVLKLDLGGQIGFVVSYHELTFKVK